MSRLVLVIALGFSASLASAEERLPEQLLPATTQIYMRWDGVAAHSDAYAKSARGKMFSGESGQAFDTMLERIARSTKVALVGDPLLEGIAPAELSKLHADVKLLLRSPRLLAERGIIVAFEIRPATFDWKTLSSLIKGEPDAASRAAEPQYQFTIIVPGGGDRPELAAAIRLAKKSASSAIKEQVVLNRKVISVAEGKSSVTSIAWAEGKHAVYAYGNQPVEKMVGRIAEAGEGITQKPLFKKISDFKDFPVVTRGFIDVAGLAAGTHKYLQAVIPERIWALDALGLTSIKNACFWDGFEGEESRGVVEIDFRGNRKGITRMFRPEQEGSTRPAPLKMSDLPALPADLTRFTALRFDPAAIYDLIPLVEWTFSGGRDDKDSELSPEARFQRLKAEFQTAIDDAVGIKLADMMGALDDKVLTYQAPSDGFMSIAQVIAIGVKDEKTLRRCLRALVKKIESQARKEVSVMDRDCLGVPVSEVVIRGRSPVTFSFAICDGWLVMALQPQPVRGFIYRSKGKLPAWKPDARTAATLAKVPADRCVIQVADPRPSLQTLLGIGPIIAGFFPESLDKGNGREPFFEPGIIPHPGEAAKHLFPNVCWCKDDGKTMRWESRDSLWLPLEFMGLETFGALGVASGLIR